MRPEFEPFAELLRVDEPFVFTQAEQERASYGVEGRVAEAACRVVVERKVSQGTGGA